MYVIAHTHRSPNLSATLTVHQAWSKTSISCYVHVTKWSTKFICKKTEKVVVLTPHLKIISDKEKYLALGR